jgi:hypothetical protein
MPLCRSWRIEERRRRFALCIAVPAVARYDTLFVAQERRRDPATKVGSPLLQCLVCLTADGWWLLRCWCGGAPECAEQTTLVASSSSPPSIRQSLHQSARRLHLLAQRSLRSPLTACCRHRLCSIDHPLTAHLPYFGCTSAQQYYTEPARNT